MSYLECRNYSKKGGFNPSSEVGHSLSKSETPKGQKKSFDSKHRCICVVPARFQGVFFFSFPITNPDSRAVIEDRLSNLLFSFL